MNQWESGFKVSETITEAVKKQAEYEVSQRAVSNFFKVFSNVMMDA